MPEIDPLAMPPCSPDRVPAFSAFFRAHYAYVHQNLRRLGVPAAAVEDAAQEVFLVVLRRTDAPITSVRGWLFGIVRRIAWRFRRGASRRERLVHALGHEPAPRADGDAQVLEREATELLDRFLARLDDDKRAVFVLAELEQQTAGEIASALGIKENTVYSRLRAARQEFDRSCARLRVREQWHVEREAVLGQARRAHAPTPATRERVLVCLIGPGVWVMSSEAAAATPAASSGGGFAAALAGFVGAPLVATVGLVLLALTGAAGQPEASAAVGAGARGDGRAGGRLGVAEGEADVFKDRSLAGPEAAPGGANEGADVLGDRENGGAVVGDRGDEASGGAEANGGAVVGDSGDEACGGAEANGGAVVGDSGDEGSGGAEANDGLDIGASGGPRVNAAGAGAKRDAGVNAVSRGAGANGGEADLAGGPKGNAARSGAGANGGEADWAGGPGRNAARSGSLGTNAAGGAGANAGRRASGGAVLGDMSGAARRRRGEEASGDREGEPRGRARRNEEDVPGDRSRAGGGARRGSTLREPEPAAPLLAPTPASDALAREAELIAQARRAIRGGAWERSLALLAVHAREFPDGTLRDERWLSQILATCAAGQIDAGRAELERLARERPDLLRKAGSLCPAAGHDSSTTGTAAGD